MQSVKSVAVGVIIFFFARLAAAAHLHETSPSFYFLFLQSCKTRRRYLFRPAAVYIAHRRERFYFCIVSQIFRLHIILFFHNAFSIFMCRMHTARRDCGGAITTSPVTSFHWGRVIVVVNQPLDCGCAVAPRKSLNVLKLNLRMQIFPHIQRVFIIFFDKK